MYAMYQMNLSLANKLIETETEAKKVFVNNRTVVPLNT